MEISYVEEKDVAEMLHLFHINSLLYHKDCYIIVKDEDFASMIRAMYYKRYKMRTSKCFTYNESIVSMEMPNPNQCGEAIFFLESIQHYVEYVMSKIPDSTIGKIREEKRSKELLKFRPFGVW